MLSTCDNLLLCLGIQGYEGHFVRHAVPKKIDPLFHDNDDDEYCTSPFSQEEFRRHIDCQLPGTDNPCADCDSLEVESTKLTNRKKERFLTPAKPKAPVSKTTPERLKLTLQEQRLKCTLLESELEKVQAELNEKVSQFRMNSKVMLLKLCQTVGKTSLHL